MKKILLLFMGLILSMSIFSYTPAPFNFHKYSVAHKRSTLPESYDSRELGIILPSRDQKQTNTCWAFTACDVSQSLFYKNGSESGELAPIIYVNCANSLGFINIDLKSGGNEEIVTAMHNMLKAPVYQKNMPSLIENYSEQCPEYTQENIHSYILDTSTLPEDDHIAIKQAIMEYGSVYASIYMNEIYVTSTFDYIYTGDMNPNHAVSIIGWDDTKSSWLVKNTWGSEWGNEGTFWVSYNDPHISKKCTSFNKFIGTDEINKVYSYSTTGQTGSFGFETNNFPSSILIVYDIEKGETIEYIATHIPNPNTKVQIAIKSSTAGNPLLYESTEEIVKYTGMHLHKLSNPIISDGEPIFVEICYTTDHYYAIPIESEGNRPNYKKLTLHGNQYFYFNNEWVPVGKDSDYPFNFVVYIYTKENYVATDLLENSVENYSKAISGNTINPDIWNYAIQINIFDISGRNFCTIKAGEELPSLNKGYYVLVIDHKDGHFTTERYNVF